MRIAKFNSLLFIFWPKALFNGSFLVKLLFYAVSNVGIFIKNIKKHLCIFVDECLLCKLKVHRQCAVFAQYEFFSVLSAARMGHLFVFSSPFPRISLKKTKRPDFFLIGCCRV